MQPSRHSLGISALPLDQRLRLVHDLWDSIAAEALQPLASAELRDELARRSLDDEQSPDDVVAWEVVRARVLSRRPT